jgi:hypothetical protein
VSPVCWASSAGSTLPGASLPSGSSAGVSVASCSANTPGPGVLSTGNAIGTPALLPDGSISHESVMVGDEEFPPHIAAPRRLDPADLEPGEVRT